MKPNLESLLKCAKCSFKTTTKLNLRRHFKRIHTRKNQLYYCYNCSYKTTRKETLAKHLKAKHVPKPIRVKIALIRSNKLKCATCNYEAYTKKNLKYHIISRHSQKNLQKCPMCDYQTVNKLKRHINSIHTRENLFICAVCNMKCADKTNLRRHIASKHKTKERDKLQHVSVKHNLKNVFTCHICTLFKARYRSKLKDHINNVHSRENVVKCTLCKYTSTKASNLRRHINSMHNLVKEPDSCKSRRSFDSYCNLKGAKKQLPSNGIKVSSTKCLNTKKTNPKVTYKCSKCSEIFHNKSNLNRHNSRKHSKGTQPIVPKTDRERLSSVNSDTFSLGLSDSSIEETTKNKVNISKTRFKLSPPVSINLDPEKANPSWFVYNETLGISKNTHFNSVKNVPPEFRCYVLLEKLKM